MAYKNLPRIKSNVETRRGFLRLGLGALAYQLLPAQTTTPSHRIGHLPHSPHKQLIEKLVTGTLIDNPISSNPPNVFIGGLRVEQPTRYTVPFSNGYDRKGELFLYLAGKSSHDSPVKVVADGFTTVLYSSNRANRHIARLSTNIFLYDGQNNPQLRIVRTNEDEGSRLTTIKGDVYFVGLRWDGAITDENGNLFNQGNEPRTQYRQWVPSVNNLASGESDRQLVTNLKNIGLNLEDRLSLEDRVGVKPSESLLEELNDYNTFIRCTLFSEPPLRIYFPQIRKNDGTTIGVIPASVDTALIITPQGLGLYAIRQYMLLPALLQVFNEDSGKEILEIIPGAGGLLSSYSAKIDLNPDPLNYPSRLNLSKDEVVLSLDDNSIESAKIVDSHLKSAQLSAAEGPAYFSFGGLSANDEHYPLVGVSGLNRYATIKKSALESITKGTKYMRGRNH